MSKEEDVLKFIGERFSYIPTEADDIVYLMTEFSSSKDARIKELEESNETLRSVAQQCIDEKEELEARLETAEKLIKDGKRHYDMFGYLSLDTLNGFDAFLTNKTE